MEEKKEYFAFISYQRQDAEWANWVAHELEHYHLPITLNGREDLPKNLRPIFRDIDELSAGNLPLQINRALEHSKHLVVICSPRSAKSKWVNKEIEKFISIGKTDKIFPFIIDGTAMSSNEKEECFPPALKNLPKNDERLGGNINEKGRDAAVVKVVAGMLDLEFDTLWQRYEREKAEEERRKQEERNRLLKVQSLYLSEKANQLINECDGYTARLLALEALPKDINAPERPYVAAAEAALRRATNCTIGRICIAPSERIGSVAFSPDAKFIVTTTIAPPDSMRDDTIKVWDVHTGRLARTFVGCDEQEGLASFSWDGKMLATVASLWDHFDIKIWDFESGKLVKTLKGHKCSLCSLAFSKDGKQLVSVSNNDHTVRIWDISSGCEQKCIELTEAITPLGGLIHPDDKRIIVTTEQSILVYDIESGEILNTIETGYWHDFWGTYIGAEGKTIAVISRENERSRNEKQLVVLWNIDDGSCICKTEKNESAIKDLFFTDNDNYFLTLSTDGIISAWKSVTGGLHQSIDLPTIFSTGRFCSDGTLQWLLTNDGLYINSLVRESKIQKFRIDSWDDEEISSIDGKIVLSVYPYELSLYEVETNHKLQTFSVKDSCFNLAILSPTNKITVASQYNGQIHVYNNETGENIITWQHPNPEDPINSIEFSPDEKQIVTSSTDKVIRTWDVNSGDLLYEFEGHQWPVHYAAYSPDGKQIVSASNDNTIMIWDVRTGEKLYSLIGHEDEVNHAVFSPDGILIASASSDKTIIIWDVNTRKKLRTLQGHTYDVKSVEFNESGTQLVSASGDETIKVWDVETGTLIQSFPFDDFSSYQKPHPFFCDAFIILPGREIFLYDYPSLQTLITSIKRRNHNLSFSEEERAKYYLG